MMDAYIHSSSTYAYYIRYLPIKPRPTSGSTDQTCADDINQRNTGKSAGARWKSPSIQKDGFKLDKILIFYKGADLDGDTVSREMIYFSFTSAGCVFWFERQTKKKNCCVKAAITVDIEGKLNEETGLGSLKMKTKTRTENRLIRW